MLIGQDAHEEIIKRWIKGEIPGSQDVVDALTREIKDSDDWLASHAEGTEALDIVVMPTGLPPGAAKFLHFKVCPDDYEQFPDSDWPMQSVKPLNTMIIDPKEKK